MATKYKTTKVGEANILLFNLLLNKDFIKYINYLTRIYFYGQSEECTDIFTKDCYTKVVLQQPEEDCDLISRKSCTPIMKVVPTMEPVTTERTQYYVFVPTILSHCIHIQHAARGANT